MSTPSLRHAASGLAYVNSLGYWSDQLADRLEGRRLRVSSLASLVALPEESLVRVLELGSVGDFSLVVWTEMLQDDLVLVVKRSKTKNLSSRSLVTIVDLVHIEKMWYDRGEEILNCYVERSKQK